MVVTVPCSALNMIKQYNRGSTGETLAVAPSTFFTFHVEQVGPQTGGGVDRALGVGLEFVQFGQDVV